MINSCGYYYFCHSGTSYAGTSFIGKFYFWTILTTSKFQKSCLLSSGKLYWNCAPAPYNQHFLPVKSAFFIIFWTDCCCFSTKQRKIPLNQWMNGIIKRFRGGGCWCCTTHGQGSTVHWLLWQPPLPGPIGQVNDLFSSFMSCQTDYITLTTYPAFSVDSLFISKLGWLGLFGW